MMKHLLALTACALLWCANAYAQATNPIADYYGNKGYPVWTDAIRWANRLDMSTYANGANDFAKFENARDELAAQGGGVLYYPAGVYDFKDHPQGPTGRGLMLKKGVVILGQAPAAGQSNAVVDSATSGLTGLQTIFQFPFHKKPAVRPDTGYVPDTWNQIGLYADASQRVSDQTFTGIAWVKLEGAYAYFGPDLAWNATYYSPNYTFRLPRKTTNAGDSQPWATHVPKGDLPFDPFTGSGANATIVAPGGFHFVFGCRFQNSCINDETTVNYVTISGVKDSSSADAYAPYRFAARVTAYGPNLFIANNALPRADKNFYYAQRVKQYGRTAPVTVDTIFYDYGKTHGIDINKELVSQVSNRCDYRVGPYVYENVVIDGNWVYNHGHKGYELAGKYMIVRDNVNQRNFLQAGDDVYGIGPQDYTLTLDGWSADGPNSDNLARAMDVGGFNAWFHHNFWTGTGSNPGNDGEGILIQPQGGMVVASWAQTFNRMGNTGKDSYISPFDVPVYGLFQYRNYLKGTGGVGNIDYHQVASDISVVENFRLDRTTPLNIDGVNGTATCDFLAACPSGIPLPPINVAVTQPANQYCNRITWVDQADNEIGFRIDRRVLTDTAWVLVAYRPRNQCGGVDTNFNPPDNGPTPAGCANQGRIDLNAQEWNDYMGKPGDIYEYRVVAINCGNTDDGTSDPVVAPSFPSSAKAQVASSFGVSVYPNPAQGAARLRTAGARLPLRITLTDATGRTLYASSLSTEDAELPTATLPTGIYHITVQDAKGMVNTRNLVKE